MFQLVPAHFLAPLAFSLVAPYASQVGNPPVGSAQQMGPASHWVLAQATSPGIAQSANTNITGTSIANAFQGNGSALTNLNADKLASGTVNDARLSSNVAVLGSAQTFNGVKTFSTAPAFTAGGAPFTVASGTKVTNLNADKLDGIDGSAFLQAVPNPLVLSNATPGGSAIWGETSASTGTGIVGISTSSTNFGLGISASSNYGIALRATSYGGVFPAVEANSNYGNGVTAYGAENGVEGSAYTAGFAGVYGHHSGDQITGGAGVIGAGFVGVQGFDNNGSGVGVWGESANYGIIGVTGVGYGVASFGSAYVGGDLTVTGSKFGYVVDLVKNGDVVALEPGEIVEIVGYEPALVGDIPVTVVRRATSARASAVFGPLDCAVAVEPLAPPSNNSPRLAHAPTYAKAAEPTANSRSPRRVPGSVAPGAYANVVTLGAFRAIRVDASYGPIRAGDLLVASPNAGYAMSESDPRIGTVVGKALSDWNAGVGEIPVLVGNR
ncbi:MAG: hypothetical protein K8S98_18925 [Planctomycetes bacterium]|nr:hypothetical protein [Planctomycetota bacterium]